MTIEARKLALLTAAAEFCDRPTRCGLLVVLDMTLDVLLHEPQHRGVDAGEDGPREGRLPADFRGVGEPTGDGVFEVGKGVWLRGSTGRILDAAQSDFGRLVPRYSR